MIKELKEIFSKSKSIELCAIVCILNATLTSGLFDKFEFVEFDAKRKMQSAKRRNCVAI